MCITYTLIASHICSCSGCEYSVCSRGYIAQDFCICAKDNRRMKHLSVVQFEQVHHVDGPVCTQIVVKYIYHEFNILTSLLNDSVTSVESG